MPAGVQAFCEDRGNEFMNPSAGEPCPECGARRRKVLATLGESLSAGEGLVAEQRLPGWKRFLRKFTSRQKLSRRGKKAREVLDIDRTHPEETVKYHHVEELEDGEWKVIHHHEDHFPARRRPPTP